MNNHSTNNGLSKIVKKESLSSQKPKSLSPEKMTRDNGKVRLGDGVAPPIFVQK